MKKEMIHRIFSRIPTLESERLLLRGLRVSDAADMFEYSRNPEVTQFLTWSPHTDMSFTKEYLTYIGQRYRTGDFFDWGCVCRQDNRMIGTCGFTKFDFTSNSAEIGYVFNPLYHGKGYATEAVRRVIVYGFEEIGLNRIEARFIQKNEASQRLMYRVGMTLEGFLRESMLIKGVYSTIGVCSILRSEYMSMKELGI